MKKNILIKLLELIKAITLGIYIGFLIMILPITIKIINPSLSMLIISGLSPFLYILCSTIQYYINHKLEMINEKKK